MIFLNYDWIKNLVKEWLRSGIKTQKLLIGGSNIADPYHSFQSSEMHKIFKIAEKEVWLQLKNLTPMVIWEIIQNWRHVSKLMIGDWDFQYNPSWEIKEREDQEYKFKISKLSFFDWTWYNPTNEALECNLPEMIFIILKSFKNTSLKRNLKEVKVSNISRLKELENRLNALGYRLSVSQRKISLSLED